MSQTTIDLKPHIALVTGASGGIGAQIALCLAQAGAGVALHFHKNSPDETAQRLRGGDKQHCVVHADMNKPGFEMELLDRVENELGTASILVNCAASQQVSSLASMTSAQFDEMITTNLGAVFSLSREFCHRLTPKMAKTASVINISSIEAARPASGHAHYAASKAALEMLTRSMALEFGPEGIRTNAVAPGLIGRKSIETDWPDGVNRWIKNCPLGRLGTAEDIAQTVLFLASDAAGFINGSVITVDGGMSATPGW